MSYLFCFLIFRIIFLLIACNSVFPKTPTDLPLGPNRKLWLLVTKRTLKSQSFAYPSCWSFCCNATTPRNWCFWILAGQIWPWPWPSLLQPFQSPCHGHRWQWSSRCWLAGRAAKRRVSAPGTHTLSGWMKVQNQIYSSWSWDGWIQRRMSEKVPSRAMRIGLRCEKTRR